MVIFKFLFAIFCTFDEYKNKYNSYRFVFLLAFMDLFFLLNVSDCIFNTFFNVPEFLPGRGLVSLLKLLSKGKHNQEELLMKLEKFERKIRVDLKWFY